VVDPELTAAIVAVALALLRELLSVLDRRRRARGELRTRASDGPPADRQTFADGEV
jgi:hypothetical protein